MSFFKRILDPSGMQDQIARLQVASDKRSQDLAQFPADVNDEIAKLAELRRWMETYPEIPADVTGDSEAMMVVRIRRILDGAGR